MSSCDVSGVWLRNSCVNTRQSTLLTKIGCLAQLFAILYVAGPFLPWPDHLGSLVLLASSSPEYLYLLPENFSKLWVHPANKSQLQCEDCKKRANGKYKLQRFKHNEKSFTSN
jgi:hypothetical protein